MTTIKMSSSKPRSLKDIAFEVAFSKFWVIELEEKYQRKYLSFYFKGDKFREDWCTDYFTIKEKSSVFYTSKEEAEKALYYLEEVELAEHWSIPCYGDDSIPLVNKLFPNRELINEDLKPQEIICWNDLGCRVLNSRGEGCDLQDTWRFEIVEIPLGG